MKKRLAATPADESGFAALMIAIVLVLILSLITVGFAQLMRKEQRSALDKQLSSQAYYAAETGVNDAAKAINDGYLGAKTGCGPGEGVDSNPDYATGLADLSSNAVASDPSNNTTGATYPCLLIDPTPPNLHYDPIDTTESRTAEFTAVDSTGTPASVAKIQISWQSTDSSNVDFAAAGGCANNFTGTWSHVGVLRAELIPLSGALDRTTLANDTFVAFLCPNSDSLPGTPGTTAYTAGIGTANAGLIANGNCNKNNTSGTTPLYCNTVITNPNPVGVSTSTYFINLRSLYSATSVTITAYDNADKALDLKGAQTLVDSTGKAQDVLRRVQVRIGSTNGYDIPDGTHGDICKQFDLTPTSTAAYGAGCSISDLTR